MPEDTQGVMPEKPEAQAQQPAVTAEQLQAELERTREALKVANREAADRRKKLESFEKLEQDKATAEMTEAQKLQKQLEQAMAELAALKTNEIRRKVAAKVGLPDALAMRIQGADEDAMEEDAKALLSAIPKPPKQQPGPTNPGANGRTGETLTQQLNRIHGRTADPWDLDLNRSMGGGVFFTGGKPED